MEQLVALCVRCSCCLSNSKHCWTCHIEIPIPELCGCGTCEEQTKDYESRMEMQRTKYLAKLGKK